MGASQSSHFAHREGRHHRFHHVGSNGMQGLCGMCSQAAELGAEVYRCGSCGFLLHAHCYGRPERIHDHFAHPGHPLTLSGGHHIAAGRQCNICAVAFDAGAGGGRPSCFVYGCGQCRGFYAHPRCAALPRTVLNHAQHPHTLTLLSPLRCLARRPQVHQRRRDAAPLATSDARSYQCNPCNVELCLACQLPGGCGGGGADDMHNGCAGDVLGTAHQVGTAIGTSLRAIGCACLGVQTHPPPVAG